MSRSNINKFANIDFGKSSLCRHDPGKVNGWPAWHCRIEERVLPWWGFLGYWGQRLWSRKTFVLVRCHRHWQQHLGKAFAKRRVRFLNRGVTKGLIGLPSGVGLRPWVGAAWADVYDVFILGKLSVFLVLIMNVFVTGFDRVQTRKFWWAAKK